MKVLGDRLDGSIRYDIMDSGGFGDGVCLIDLLDYAYMRKAE